MLRAMGLSLLLTELIELSAWGFSSACCPPFPGPPAVGRITP